MDGSMSKAAKAATDEAKRLATLVDVPVEMHDERLTTVTADRSMLDAGMNAVERRQRRRQGRGGDHAAVVARRPGASDWNAEV